MNGDGQNIGPSKEMLTPRVTKLYTPTKYRSPPLEHLYVSWVSDCM